MTPDEERAYLADMERQRAERDERLRRPDGWLTLVGLCWLHEGENRVGTDAGNEVVLPSTELPPGQLATIIVAGDGLRLRQPGGRELEIADDLQPDGPTPMEFGRLQVTVIRRSGRLAARIKDPESPVRRDFRGVSFFPPDLAWRLTGRFEPLPAPEPVVISTFVGVDVEDEIRGSVAFEVAGQTYRLLTTSPDDDGSLELAFCDATNGHETYAAGRYLPVEPPGPKGEVVVDFNVAYNPPCLFTPYATCVLPLAANRLPIRIEAGERADPVAH